MSTPAQILANRENAQLSTGPLTEAGKAASSQNALRHGLAARGLIVLPGQEPAFADLEYQLRRSLVPGSPLQETIFKRVLESTWNLHRCRLAEAQFYFTATDHNIDPLLDDANAAKYARIEKYARQSANAMDKALRELGKLQAESQYRHEAYTLTEEQITDDEQFQQTPHSLSEVCPYENVMASVARQRKVEATTKFRNKAKPNPFAALERLTAPPSTRRDFQFEANATSRAASAAA